MFITIAKDALLFYLYVGVIACFGLLRRSYINQRIEGRCSNILQFLRFTREDPLFWAFHRLLFITTTAALWPILTTQDEDVTFRDL